MNASMSEALDAAVSLSRGNPGMWTRERAARRVSADFPEVNESALIEALFESGDWDDTHWLDDGAK